jgi:hypothetical protein
MLSGLKKNKRMFSHSPLLSFPYPFSSPLLPFSSPNNSENQFFFLINSKTICSSPDPNFYFCICLFCRRTLYCPRPVLAAWRPCLITYMHGVQTSVEIFLTLWHSHGEDWRDPPSPYCPRLSSLLCDSQSSYLIVLTTLQGHCHAHYADEDNEVPRGQVTYPSLVTISAFRGQSHSSYLSPTIMGFIVSLS